MGKARNNIAATVRRVLRKRPRLVWYAAACGFALAVVLAVLRGCGGGAPKLTAIPPPTEEEKGDVLVTGYCSCGECCGWRRSWLGLGPPVYTYGPMKGRRKKVGVTARGTVAKHGTVAADPKVFPFGTRLKIPGYGTGVVEDVGGAINGRHIDVWFPSHEEARLWGRRSLKVVPLH